jgi:PilZ domain
MLNSQNSWLESSFIHNEDRRREPRDTIEFPIEVSGFDRFGKFHTEYTKTSNVSIMGCSFHLNMEVEKGLVLALRVFHPRNGRETNIGPVLFQVVRTEPRQDGCSLGVLRLQPENPWSDYSQIASDPQKPLS